MLKFVLAAALTVVSFQTTVRAAEQHRIVVAYGDLDLSRAEGQSRFERRISRTVRQFCNDAVAYPNLSAVIAQRDCADQLRASLDQARAVAVARAVDRPLLAANSR